MSLTHQIGRVGLVAGLATLALTSVGVAATRDANNEALTEIAALKAELAEIKAQQGDNWLTEARASEIRSLVQDVLADADTRASLQSSGMTAGWDKGFFLASPDGNFKLRVSGQLQIRYILSYRDIQGAVQGDRWTKGFENGGQTYLSFDGHIVDKTWSYKVQGGFNSEGGAFILEDAWAQKDFDNGLYVRAGQFKAPYLREELVDSGRQLAVDRSILNERFNQNYSQGIEVGFESDVFRAGVMYSDGTGDNNFLGTSTQNTQWNATTTEYAFTARAEFLAAGDWKQFEDFTSWNGESFGLMIGAAANYQTQEYGTAANGEQTNAGFTADVSVEFGGANLFGAFVYNNPDSDNDNAADADQFGFLVQGGIFLVPDSVELFGRYEFADADAANTNDLSVITGGLNWYFAKHSAKFTFDVGYSLEDFDGAWDEPNIGWLNAFGEDEFVFRSQLTLKF